MNTSELKDILQREGYRKDAYCIGSPGARTECLCIEASGSRWRIFYAERGLLSFAVLKGRPGGSHCAALGCSGGVDLDRRVVVIRP